MAYDIEVVDTSENGTTGMIDVVVRAVEDVDGQIRKGPIRKYGIDTQSLQTLYGGDVMQWLQWVKREHQAHHGLHTSMVATLGGLRGKRI